jgi:hypothetical protein
VQLSGEVAKDASQERRLWYKEKKVMSNRRMMPRFVNLERLRRRFVIFLGGPTSMRRNPFRLVEIAGDGSIESPGDSMVD